MKSWSRRRNRIESRIIKPSGSVFRQATPPLDQVISVGIHIVKKNLSEGVLSVSPPLNLPLVRFVAQLANRNASHFPNRLLFGHTIDGHCLAATQLLVEC